MTPEDLIDELQKKVLLAPDEPELEAALDELQSALQEYRDYLGELGRRLPFEPPSRYPEALEQTPRTNRRLDALAC